MLRSELTAARAELAAVEVRLTDDREREALMRGELQLRVRNVLAIVRSVFSRTVASGGTLDEVADHFRGRLEVLARYQHSRVSNPNGLLDMDLVVRDELHDFQFGDDPRISIEGDEASLTHDQAQNIGLALHELVTNALKFGALAQPAGRLQIRWSVSDTVFRLAWTESGVPVIAAAPLHYGFGRELLEQGLPYQLGATTSFALRPGGLDCRIAFAPATGIPAKVS